QKKLKKAIKNKEYMRVGGGAPVPNRARIISGSSLDVDVLVKNELFEGDLYRALSFNAVNVTALSKRQEDIPLLVNHFIKQSAIAYNIPEKKFNNEAMSVLISYYWPGDVMQLRNLIDWVLVMSNSMASSNDNDDDDNSGGMLGAETLPKEITDGKTPGGTCDVKFISSLTNLSIKDAREAFEREYLREQLRKFSGNVSQTSKFVGMERSALHRKLKFLNISDIEGTDNIETEKIEDGEIR
ncbi:MAG: sigma 54-interacting transcriptional regulator, partial [Holosporales bacterium]|nr:sigma 54-interacting transcriptional regulator [Holosporales bacterium]